MVSGVNYIILDVSIYICDLVCPFYLLRQIDAESNNDLIQTKSLEWICLICVLWVVDHAQNGELANYEWSRAEFRVWFCQFAYL